ncbi:flavin reductase family protein [Boseongicola aestuarii]|uniref:FMN reductase (NADH) NtaB n=1 Tax=Boseongicola aestuarii TaxID=1470561 RepID=A0A238IZE5_9RHOB|nr:flavin reductase family protein [Boseongicola aestuarii]SMX23858.1 FMN reductase (NADH) NtaB [Boseongicola aestuarii]
MTAFTPTLENARAFRDALGTFATGVTIVTCKTETGPIAIAANSFSSLSLDPALVLWSPAKSSRRFPAFEAARHYAIHVLNAEQVALCQTFARDGTAFDGLDYSENAHGVPLINGCLARFECTQHAIHDGGDHVIIVGEVNRAEMTDGAPLVFSKGSYGRFTDVE